MSRAVDRDHTTSKTTRDGHGSLSRSVPRSKFRKERTRERRFVRPRCKWSDPTGHGPKPTQSVCGQSFVATTSFGNCFEGKFFEWNAVGITWTPPFYLGLAGIGLDNSTFTPAESIPLGVRRARSSLFCFFGELARHVHRKLEIERRVCYIVGR